MISVPEHGDALDVLDLGPNRRLAILEQRTAGAPVRSAVPQVRDTDGGWRRGRPGDGAAEAMLETLAATSGSQVRGRFTVVSWTERAAAGERAIDVDQTNESVIVGGAAVVKWATHLQDGPHPAPRRIALLRESGFDAMPTPWGLVTWRPPDGAETLAVTVDEYLPGAVDGWTWAVELITEAAGAHGPRATAVLTAAAAVGVVVADLHAALAGTARVATASDAVRWRDEAMATLVTAAASTTSQAGDVLRERRTDIENILDGLGALAGTTVLEGHGDLHVGQVLRAGGRFVITDFDGNPVLPAEQRVLPIPAALDVAGMTQSLAHVAIVARKYADLDPSGLAEVDLRTRRMFLDAYVDRLAALGLSGLFDSAALRAFRLQQVLREIIYAARHLPRWMYVPDAALPALLGETTRDERGSG